MTQTYTPFKTSSMTLTMIKTIKTNMALLNLSLMILETLNPKFKQFSPKYQLFYPIQKKILNFLFSGTKNIFSKGKKKIFKKIYTQLSTCMRSLLCEQSKGYFLLWPWPLVPRKSKVDNSGPLCQLNGCSLSDFP